MCKLRLTQENDVDNRETDLFISKFHFQPNATCCCGGSESNSRLNDTNSFLIFADDECSEDEGEEGDSVEWDRPETRETLVPHDLSQQVVDF